MGQLVKKYVLKKLDEVIPGIYNDANVVLSATHTHSGPAGIRGFTAVFFPDFVEYYIFWISLNLWFNKYNKLKMFSRIYAVRSVQRTEFGMDPAINGRSRKENKEEEYH